MELLIPMLVILGALIISAICDWMHNDEIFPEGIEYSEDIFHEAELRETDIEYAEKSREILIRHLGQRPIDRILAEQNAEARIKMIIPLYEDVAALYGIPAPKLKLLAEKSPSMGGYSVRHNVLELNVAFLLVNDPECIREFLDTIFHELRHAVQHHMVKTPGFWNADPQLRGRLAYNLQPRHYIRPEKDPEGYRNQFVEQDAFNFAACVMRGV